MRRRISSKLDLESLLNQSISEFLTLAESLKIVKRDLSDSYQDTKSHWPISEGSTNSTKPEKIKALRSAERAYTSGWEEQNYKLVLEQWDSALNLLESIASTPGHLKFHKEHLKWNINVAKAVKHVEYVANRLKKDGHVLSTFEKSIENALIQIISRDELTDNFIFPRDRTWNQIQSIHDKSYYLFSFNKLLNLYNKGNEEEFRNYAASFGFGVARDFHVENEILRKVRKKSIHSLDDLSELLKRDVDEFNSLKGMSGEIITELSEKYKEARRKWRISGRKKSENVAYLYDAEEKFFAGDYIGAINDLEKIDPIYGTNIEKARLHLKWISLASLELEIYDSIAGKLSYQMSSNHAKKIIDIKSSLGSLLYHNFWTKDIKSGDIRLASAKTMEIIKKISRASSNVSGHYFLKEYNDARDLNQLKVIAADFFEVKIARNYKF